MKKAMPVCIALLLFVATVLGVLFRKTRETSETLAVVQEHVRSKPGEQVRWVALKGTRELKHERKSVLALESDVRVVGATIPERTDIKASPDDTATSREPAPMAGEHIRTRHKILFFRHVAGAEYLLRQEPLSDEAPLVAGCGRNGAVWIQGGASAWTPEALLFAQTLATVADAFARLPAWLEAAEAIGRDAPADPTVPGLTHGWKTLTDEKEVALYADARSNLIVAMDIRWLSENRRQRILFEEHGWHNGTLWPRKLVFAGDKEQALYKGVFAIETIAFPEQVASALFEEDLAHLLDSYVSDDKRANEIDEMKRNIAEAITRMTDDQKKSIAAVFAELAEGMQAIDDEWPDPSPERDARIKALEEKVDKEISRLGTIGEESPGR